MRFRLVAAAFFFSLALAPSRSAAADPVVAESAQYDQLVARLRALTSAENRWGPAWQPIYHAALPWYERWGGRPRHDVDNWMSPPETYAEELANALEHDRNFFAENPGSLFPLVFSAKLPDGRTVEANYWLTLPAGFPADGRKFPLVIGLHGSGWLGHKISFVRQPRKDNSGGRTFVVTPIDEAGPWQIDFLNAYLDELLRLLPVDADRVYVEGHSLGAMATWEWALDNPERLAAISPRAGRGEPFRASRLHNVPAWVIHGGRDNVVPSGFADQMVTALEAGGGRVRYSVLPEVEHNMPDDLDESQVIDWYLRQTRSSQPPPPDPREQLGIAADGYSSSETVTEPAATVWQSEPVLLSDRDACLRAVRELFERAHARGALVDASLVMQFEPKTGKVRFRLPIPKSLRTGAPVPTDAIIVRATRCLRFYARGKTADGAAHAIRVASEAAGSARDEVWITPLSLWLDTPNYLAEYRVPLD